mmetsp:Transcript_18950/g.39507  ORF Transcript_18950/g.39507 Transcript_18950/m.39507 type:complete len:245 (-) Transcript_18950:1280-2014(-)
MQCLQPRPWHDTHLQLLLFLTNRLSRSKHPSALCGLVWTGIGRNFLLTRSRNRQLFLMTRRPSLQRLHRLLSNRPVPQQAREKIVPYSSMTCPRFHPNHSDSTSIPRKHWGRYRKKTTHYVVAKLENSAAVIGPWLEVWHFGGQRLVLSERHFFLAWCEVFQRVLVLVLRTGASFHQYCQFHLELHVARELQLQPEFPTLSFRHLYPPVKIGFVYSQHPMRPRTWPPQGRLLPSHRLRRVGPTR